MPTYLYSGTIDATVTIQMRTTAQRKRIDSLSSQVYAVSTFPYSQPAFEELSSGSDSFRNVAESDASSCSSPTSVCGSATLGISGSLCFCLIQRAASIGV